jgi:dolichol-phosphate mannosyltransferase
MNDHKDVSPVSGSGPALSVVAPCYNEEHCLDELHRRVTAACRDCLQGRPYEIVLVNDGSRDGTWAKIRALAARDDHVVGVSLARNHGHQLALTAGLTVCRGDRTLIIDADLQDPPELLGEMMRAMDDGADVVYGQRHSRAGEAWFKLRTAHLFYRVLNRLVDVYIPVDTGDFRLISRRALDVLNDMPERNRFIRGMVSWIGLRQVPLRYDRNPRLAGRTGYPWRKMLLLAIDAITSFSILPLRVASTAGLVAGILGFVFLAIVLFDWLTGGTVPGWTSTISVILLMGSIQLVVLGIFGEYLGRMFFEVKRRPMFVIDEIVGRSTPPVGREGAHLDRPAAAPVPPSGAGMPRR